MGTLKKPTIEGFVDKLIDDNHIRAFEIGSVQGTLEKATNEMSSEEKVIFIKTLSDRVDAPASDLITPNGLNYTSFESTVQEVYKVIEKERNDRKETTKQTNIDENLLVDMTEKERQEIEEKERQEKILENERSIDDFLTNFLGESDIELPEEDKKELAEDMYTVERLDELVAQYEAMGNKPDESLKLAMEDLGLTEETLSSDRMKLAQTTVVGKKAQRIFEQEGGSKEECLKKILEQNAVSSRTLRREIESNPHTRELTDKVQALKIIWYGMNEKVRESRCNISSVKVKHLKEDAYLNITDLKLEIEKREKNRRLAKNSKEKLAELTGRYVKDPKKESAKKALFKELTDEYLATGGNVFELYESYSGTEIIGDLDFDDVLEGIANELRSNVNGVVDVARIDAWINHERECRIIKLAENEQREALKNIPPERKSANMEDVNVKHIINYTNAARKREESLADLKQDIIQKRGIDPKDPKWKKTKMSKKAQEDKLQRSSAQALKNRNEVLRDRAEIIKLKKERKISAEEATRIYFAENPEALKNYSKAEQEALLADKQEDAEIKNSTLEKFKTIILERNMSAMGKIVIKLEERKRYLEKLENGGFSTREIIFVKKEIEKLTAKYQKIESSINSIAKTESQSKNDLWTNKEKELIKEEIFKDYVESGKTVAEIFEGIEATGNGHNFSFEDVLGIISDNAKKALLPKDLKELIKNERNIYMSTQKIESYDKKIQMKEGVTESRKIFYREKRQIANEEREDAKKRTVDYKNTIALRLGIVRNAEGQKEADTIRNNAQDMTQDTDMIGLEREDNSQTELTTAKLEIAEIETTPGMIPNVNAIAQKGNVTRSSVKAVFSKIFSLRKGKGETSKVESKNGGNGKDSAVDQEVVQ